jgi:hypothetical protein
MKLRGDGRRGVDLCSYGSKQPLPQRSETRNNLLTFGNLSAPSISNHRPEAIETDVHEPCDRYHDDTIRRAFHDEPLVGNQGLKQPLETTISREPLDRREFVGGICDRCSPIG